MHTSRPHRCRRPWTRRPTTLALALLITAMVLSGNEEVRAVGDSTRLTFDEDSIPRQLTRRLARAPKGRLIWIRLERLIRRGPVVRTTDSILVTRGTGSSAEELLEYNAAGRIRKRRALGRPLAADPVLDPLGRLITVNDRGLIRWIRPGLTDLRTRNISRPSKHAPAVDAFGGLYVAHRNGNVTHFDASGRFRWRTKLKGKRPGRPVIVRGGCVLCSGTAKSLVRIRQAGSTAWEIPLTACYTRPLVTPGGGIVVASKNRLSTFTNTGKLQWRMATVASTSSPVRAPDGTLYVASQAGVLHAVSATGAPRWSFPVGRDRQPSQPVIGPRGRVYVASPLGHLLVLSPAGKLLWHHALPKGRNRVAVRWDGSVLVVTRGNSFRMVAPPRTKP